MAFYTNISVIDTSHVYNETKEPLEALKQPPYKNHMREIC